MLFCWLLQLLVLYTHLSQCSEQQDPLTVYTVATSENDAYRRFMSSVELNNIPVKVLGQGSEWTGGDVLRYPGGGQKINFLKAALEPLKHDTRSLILFTDSYDVVLLDGVHYIIQQFIKIGANIVFSTEQFCWPDKSLCDKYPKVEEHQKRYLNSGGYIGYASTLYRLLTVAPVADADDDQLYFTKIFLNDDLRNHLGIVLDYNNLIFQTLNGASGEITIRTRYGLGYIYNVNTKSNPAVFHGNGPVKHEFNRLVSYLGQGWTPTEGCQTCQVEATISTLPSITVGIFITEAAPFVDLFFKRFAAQTVPKNRINLHIILALKVANIDKALGEFIHNSSNLYAGLTFVNISHVNDPLRESVNMRRSLLKNEDNSECILFLDPVAQLTNAATLQELVSYNRSIIAPMLLRPGQLWANFWGSLSEYGYYARADDYLDIIGDARQGLWNVPYVSNVYLINKRAAKALYEKGAFLVPAGLPVSEYDVDFARTARDNYIFMYIINTKKFGHLSDNTNSTTHHVRNDLWEIFQNPTDWAEKYIHKDYYKYVSDEMEMQDFEQPCPDVFWLPLVSPQFCEDLVTEMEAFGKWSDGSNSDPRLEGGYENVPTRDIHMRQIEWEPHWLHYLVKYVHPIQVKVFQGYNDKPWARMNFIVRYKPDEQKELRPHHDASDYTINIALNRVGVDFLGGGCAFPRYKCSILNLRLGWGFLHPGRITHLHEGLEILNGTRYIFVTFVNP